MNLPFPTTHLQPTQSRWSAKDNANKMKFAEVDAILGHTVERIRLAQCQLNWTALNQTELNWA